MAKAIIQAFKEATTSKGSTIFKCSGTIDGEMDFFEMWTKPEIGKEYEGEVKDSQYGKTFSLPRSGGGGFRNDPATRMEIIRQNALTNAVNRAIGLSQILPQEEAKQALNPNNIVKVASWFARYTSGNSDPSVANQAAPSSSAPAASPQVNEDVNRQVNQEVLDQDIDPDDIPF